MKKQKKKNLARPYIKELYRGSAPLVALNLFSAVLSTATSLLVSWLMLALFDLIGGVEGAPSITECLLFAVVALALLVITHLILTFSSPKFKKDAISRYKNFIFKKITKKNISAFSGESSALYISALTNDITVIEKAYLDNIFELATMLLTFMGSIAMMIYYSPLLTLILILLTLLPLVVSILIGSKAAEAETRVSDKNAYYTASIKDAIMGFSVVKSFKAEAEMCKMFASEVRSLESAKARKDRIIYIIGMLSNCAGFIAQIGVFIVAAYLALTDRGITAGTVILFVQMMNYILSPISTIPTYLAELKSARALVEKTAEALEENVREEVPAMHTKLGSSIALSSLSFSYNGEKQALKNISYTFKKGKKYAIVGASGSGKSTLLSLLMASYGGYKGSISYDGKELRDINTADLYEMQSIIQQSVFVFNASIKDNITMFKSFPENELERAIRLSGLSTLMRDKGEDYLCGEGGNALSGGEKQRISIARSLLSNAQVLLVDEATASLDNETAFAVTSSILSLDDITVIEVTHALDGALLERYDGILTLKDGSLIEHGTFRELIDKKGYFYSLYTISQ